MRKTYATPEITVSYDRELCIHAARCVAGLPGVFDPNARPWIRPEAAPAGELAEVVRRCPTGALRYELAGGPAEEPDPEVTIRPEKNGPLDVRGRVRIEDPRGNALDPGPRVALCRCGGSKRKPFCDNSHRALRFAADQGSVLNS